MSNQEDAIFNIKDQKEYLGGFIGTGIMALVQTVTPLLVYQLAYKDGLRYDVNNPWFTYARQAMQAGGVVSYGLITLAFLGNFMFKYNLMERLGYLYLWATHGGILAMLSFCTVFSYLIVALAKYEMSAYSDMTEIGVTLAVYSVIQIGFLFLFKYTIRDTVLYMVAGELKTICEKYGEFCSEYGVLEKQEQQSEPEELEGENLVNWVW